MSENQKLTQKEINDLLEMKVKRDQEMKKRKEYNKRRAAKLQLFCEKALAAGITVSEEEIDQYLTK